MTATSLHAADDAALSARVAAQIAGLPARLDADPALIHRGRFLTVDCLLGVAGAPHHVAITAGRITAIEPGPKLMRPWRFAYRASARGFAAFWQEMPAPGWHDLLALMKRGEAELEGDVQPFLANLQYFKDLLALPRGRFEGGAA